MVLLYTDECNVSPDEAEFFIYVGRRVSMSLRHPEVKFSEYLRLSFGVC